MSDKCCEPYHSMASMTNKCVKQWECKDYDPVWDDQDIEQAKEDFMKNSTIIG